MIRIIRGLNQIGGSVIELSTYTTKILFDLGVELDEGNENLDIELFDEHIDGTVYDAVFLSHYHADHMGLVYKLEASIPIFMGEKAASIINASNNYLSKPLISPKAFLKHKQTIVIGDIHVTPYLCDHSAFDSYMLLAEENGEKILYTGDFRANGRKNYDYLLNELPRFIDILICEGTTLSRESYTPILESELEYSTTELVKSTKGPVFVLLSSMNIDRIVTMYRVSKRTKRLFLVDLYMAEITNSLGGKIPNPVGFHDVRVFITRPYAQNHFRYLLYDKYGISKIGKAAIAKETFVMCLRTSMGEYLKSLSQIMDFTGGIVFYSFWKGYKEQKSVKEFLELCRNLGLKEVDLHTSGHIDAEGLKEFIRYISPKQIIPVHTENAAWFSENFSELIL